ncbi:MAG: hypothetical protein IKP62_10765 [Salinivirgaceae bacterium]|nr:hypothetical protein [Salinivirgaceae bacterium]
MEFTSEQLQKLSATIKRGDLFLINMDESNGITPKDGESDRRKFFIVMGVTESGTVYGGVVINSSIDKVPSHLRNWYIPLQQYRYSFLQHDSYVNCLQIKEVPQNKFGSWLFLGCIEEIDLSLISNKLITSPMENAERLSRFGLGIRQ